MYCLQFYYCGYWDTLFNFELGVTNEQANASLMHYKEHYPTNVWRLGYLVSDGEC